MKIITFVFRHSEQISFTQPVRGEPASSAEEDNEMPSKQAEEPLNG